MSIPRSLDHIVIAGPDLAAAVDEIERLTGVRAAPGGKHPTGTANHLIALTVDGHRGPQYIEIIGPDPEREDAALPPTFGIDRLSEVTVAAYATHPEDLDATAAAGADAGVDPGPVRALSRRKPDGDLLEWRLTSTRVPDASPILPFLIDWGATAHPGLSDLPVLELVSFTGTDADPAALAEVVSAYGTDLEIAKGDSSRLTLTVRGPAGTVTI